MEQSKPIKAINKVLDYLAANLNTPVDLQSMADYAGISPFHFHRVFKAVTGQTPAQYVLNKRLEMAADRLLSNPEESVTNIAYEGGFNSTHVFCRNFKKHFGQTAEAFRQQYSKNDQQVCNNSQTDEDYHTFLCKCKTYKKETMEMNFDFEMKPLPELSVIYWRHYGAYNQMQNAFEQLMQWAYPRGLVAFPKTRLISIFHNNPNLSQTEKCIADAAMTVEQPIKAEGPIGTCILPGGNYAVGRFEIGIDEFPTAWNCMFETIRKHRCECNGLPYEVYLNDRNTHPQKKWIVDICIPVKPL